MKHNILTITMLAACLLTPHSLLYGQTRSITLKTEGQTVQNVLSLLEKQSGYKFFYKDGSFDKTRPVSVSAVGEDVLSVVGAIFEGTGIRASIIDGNIVLSAIADTPAQPVPQTTATVRGVVLSTGGVPVPGAAVIPSSGPANAVVTDLDGNFTVTAAPGESLTFSSMGYQDRTVAVPSDGALMSVTLSDDIELLDEVVVVGYGVQKRSDITGAISSVSAEQAKQVPTSSVAEMLRGAAPGLQVNVSSAAPGGSSTIIIRGRHSLSGDNTPLYIVDGVPMTSIDDVNPSDIESIEVLKDASSQSIYGARAANGVILVTTRRGSEGKTRVSYDGYGGVQTVVRNFEFYDGEQWAAYRHEAFYNAYGYYDKDECFRGYMSDVLDSGEYIDWEAQMIHPAVQTSHNVSVQAGKGKNRMSATLGYYGQNGMVTGSDFSKLSGRLNLDRQFSQSVSAGANLSYMRSWKHSADGTFSSFVTMPPLARIYDDDGNLLEDVTEAGETHTNPLWNIANSSNETVQNRLLLNAFLDWKIADWISYRLNASLSERDVNANSYLGIRHTTGKNTQGKATISDSHSSDYLVENILNLNRDFSGRHKFDATLMQSINVIKWRKTGFTGTGFSNDDLAWNAITSALEYGKPDYELSGRHIVSFLGRARYNFDDRYLFSAALRVDGSSVFGENNKFGFFPSAAFAWRASNEDFLKDSRSWLNNLKLRLSWGQVGNQGISPYTTLGSTTAYYYRFGDEVAIGYLPSSALYNPDLKWETTSTLNAGIDFGLFRDRINGSVELYDSETSDLLVSKSINQVLGYTTQMVNLGRVSNKGIEIALNTTPVSTRDFSWDLDFSFARNVNAIREISGETDEEGNPLDDVNNNWFIGSPVSVYYDYQFDGIWQLDDDIENSCMPTATPGSIRIADTDKDGSITDADRVVMSRDPDWIGSVTTSFSLYRFDLSATLNASVGGTFYNSYLTLFNNGGDLTGKRNGIRRNYWTLYNPSTDTPKPNMEQAPAYITALGYQDASYLRLRSVVLGYTFKPEKLSHVGLSSLRLYLSGTNLWYCTEVQGYGPEQSPGAYPEPRTFIFGAKMTF